MRTALALTALSIVLASTAPALASEEASCGNAPRDQWLSEDAIKAKAAALDYDVRSVKIEDGCYEAYAIAGNGQRVEVYLNPLTGDVVRTKADD